MTDKNRQYGRIKKPLTAQFCLVDVYPEKWDMSIIKNISAGGVMFTAPSDSGLTDKIIRLRIRVPDLLPHLLDIQAVVLNANPSPKPQYSFIRAKFINLTEANKKHLIIVKKMVEMEEIKNTKDQGNI